MSPVIYDTLIALLQSVSADCTPIRSESPMMGSGRPQTCGI